MKKLTLVLALLLFSSPAWGQKKTIKDFLEAYDKAPLKAQQGINIKFIDYENGMGWANSHLEIVRGEKPLYCPPKKLRLTGEQAFQIFREEVERKVGFAKKLSVKASGFFLLGGLIRTFPCK